MKQTEINYKDQIKINQISNDEIKKNSIKT
jgi:hypothetical protein